MTGGFGGFGMILWVVLIGALIWWAIQAATAQKGQSVPPTPAHRTPREILELRKAME